MTEPYLTTVEVAAILRCHEKTVRRWIIRGELQATYIGGRYLIDPEDVPGARPERSRPRRRGPGKAPGPVTEALRKAGTA